ncbi:hypothetical protein NDU88_010786 [Pleurodeles waltl]|uniref:Uncharacterized protein n=1 Tax=Pleurodeles waltl TaxID=8319 RepID=A0AAV7PVW6_PLEWA|nr:hypothetical protein NDU88_010786 [Pleurodeles waltl]
MRRTSTNGVLEQYGIVVASVELYETSQLQCPYLAEGCTLPQTGDPGSGFGGPRERSYQLGNGLKCGGGEVKIGIACTRSAAPLFDLEESMEDSRRVRRMPRTSTPGTLKQSGIAAVRAVIYIYI